MFPLRRPPADDQDLIPATGAWIPGDPPAGRRFAPVCSERSFALEGGGRLDEITVAYETWGTLDATASNALLVCHALTGDAHAAGQSGPGQPTPGWWDDLIGPGRAFDTDQYFIVCANVIGGCQGSTGPASPHPYDGEPYGSRFPVVSIRDIVRTQALLADHLGIERWLSVIGGSMGGMQALEWPIIYPERVASTVLLATAMAASPLQIGWSEVGRLAVAHDPKWNNGDYYHAGPGEGPHEGLMLARRVAQIHYRSDLSLANRFGRTTVDRLDQFNLWDRFQVESYLDYHGQKLARRFDANSYLLLNKAMDLHDIGRGRGGPGVALGRVDCPCLVVSIDSDTLYPPRQQVELRDLLVASGATVEYEVIHSDHGHDGFLLEYSQLTPLLEGFIADQIKSD
ncbi:MAG: homoserine O-acetyltransferase [Actinomycetia bacterium]|nr:homoserine O-acetyltransferase [Actinomycetes bacterium]MCP4222180.1 homoserine O-acetyltransferase [Actinomycetes bacterium]MCP5035110.1 homoserine O-acetyltransferase [Actinomycetes bacterium]